MRVVAFHFNGPKPATPSHLSYSEGIIPVCLIHLQRNRGVHMPRMQTNYWQARVFQGVPVPNC
tara:strand:- start:286 stop:474 length:189 start_codon:yes stop_codon:yes gene_type:complete